MKNIPLTILFSTAMLSLTFISCNSNKKQDKVTDSILVDTSETNLRNSTDTNGLSEIEAGESEAKVSPIHGNLTPASLAKYYPNITDTIKQKANILSNRLDVEPGNGVMVSLLHNSAVSDQMFLCTHDKKLNLIDVLNIGTATDFDGGQSHTIQTKIINNNEIVFDQIDWGYIKKGEEEEIDTVRHEIWTVRIDKNGLIKKTVSKKKID